MLEHAIPLPGKESITTWAQGTHPLLCFMTTTYLRETYTNTVRNKGFGSTGKLKAPRQTSKQASNYLFIFAKSHSLSTFFFKNVLSTLAFVKKTKSWLNFHKPPILTSRTQQSHNFCNTSTPHAVTRSMSKVAMTWCDCMFKVCSN